jgi:adenylosuccinate lyase
MEAGRQVKVEGKTNDLIERIAGDAMFGLSLDELQAVLEPRNYIGRAPEQVVDFYNDHIKPALENNQMQDMQVELKV